MTIETIKEMMEVCFVAKRIRDMLPKLPQGVAPSYIHYLDVIQKLEKERGKVKISDVSDVLELPRPGVTRTVKEMEKKGYLRKTSSEQDGRITYITLTEQGTMLHSKYDKKYYGELVKYLDDISEEDARVTIQTLNKVYRVMSERRINLE